MKKFKSSKNLYITIGALLAFLLVVMLVYSLISNSKDSVKFKKEYEKFNGVKTSEGNKYQSIKIKRNNKIEYITMAEAVEIIKNGTGIIYFGKPDCPWCRGLVPIMLDKIDCSCLEKVYYVDMTDLRDIYEIKDEMPEETKRADKEYYELLELLDEYLESYTLTDETGMEHILSEKRIYLPFVVGVNGGNIVGGHTGTVDLEGGQSAYDELTDTQKSELEVVFTNLIEGVTKEKTTCEGHC